MSLRIKITNVLFFSASTLGPRREPGLVGRSVSVCGVRGQTENSADSRGCWNGDFVPIKPSRPALMLAAFVSIVFIVFYFTNCVFKLFL